MKAHCEIKKIVSFQYNKYSKVNINYIVKNVDFNLDQISDAIIFLIFNLSIFLRIFQTREM